MSLKLWNEPETTPEVFLRLVHDNGFIQLVMCYKSGETIVNGKVLEISPHGRIFRSVSINKDAARNVGLQLDDIGRVKFSGDELT